MKKLILWISLMAAASCLAQRPFVPGGPTNRTAALEPRPYAIVERGPHSRVWERVVVQETPFGPQPTVQQYTELQTGMHYLVDGKWVEAKEEIESYPDGAKTCSAHLLSRSGPE